jgi:diamine N-acetyltransferase
LRENKRIIAEGFLKINFTFGGWFMIKLKEINEDNFSACIKLNVAENQKSFVASNVYSLAQAWLYPENARPFSIYDDEIMVGFLMLDIDFHWYGEKNVCYLWRLMIDENYQGKGYGKKALQLAIEYIKKNVKPDKIKTSFVPGNEAAEKLYISTGFKANGEKDGDEIVLVIDLASKAENH